jgi:hypothetical protein
VSSSCYVCLNIFNYVLFFDFYLFTHSLYSLSFTSVFKWICITVFIIVLILIYLFSASSFSSISLLRYFSLSRSISSHPLNHYHPINPSHCHIVIYELIEYIIWNCFWYDFNFSLNFRKILSVLLKNNFLGKKNSLTVCKIISPQPLSVHSLSRSLFYFLSRSKSETRDAFEKKLSKFELEFNCEAKDNKTKSESKINKTI